MKLSLEWGVWSDSEAQVLNLWPSSILDGQTCLFTVKKMSSGTCTGAQWGVGSAGTGTSLLIQQHFLEVHPQVLAWAVATWCPSERSLDPAAREGLCGSVQGAQSPRPAQLATPQPSAPSALFLWPSSPCLFLLPILLSGSQGITPAVLGVGHSVVPGDAHAAFG